MSLSYKSHACVHFCKRMQTAREVFDELVERTAEENMFGSVVGITRSNTAATGDVVVFSFTRKIETSTFNAAPSALKASRATNSAAGTRGAMKLEMKTQSIEVDGRWRIFLKFRIYDYDHVFNKVKYNNDQMYATFENEAKGFTILFTRESRYGKFGTPVNAIFQFKDPDDRSHSFECVIQHEGEVSTRGITFWVAPSDASIEIPQLIKKLLYAARFYNEDFLRETTRRQTQRIAGLEDEVLILRARLRELDEEGWRDSSDSDGSAGDTSGSDSD